MTEDDRPPREMPSSECWESIESAPYGRIGPKPGRFGFAGLRRRPRLVDRCAAGYV